MITNFSLQTSWTLLTQPQDLLQLQNDPLNAVSRISYVIFYISRKPYFFIFPGSPFNIKMTMLMTELIV